MGVQYSQNADLFSLSSLVYLSKLFLKMSNSCNCGSWGHEKIDECYTKQCACCLNDHQGTFAKNRR